MVTKIFLGLAILCGIGAIVVGLMIVKPRILDTEKARDEAKASFASEQTAHGQTKATLAMTQMTLASTQMELDNTKTSLAAKTMEAEGLSKQVADLGSQKTALEGDLAKAKAENQEFVDFHHSMQEIRATFEKLPKVEKERDAVNAENKVLALEVKKLNNRIIDLVGGTPVLPEGLTAKVVAVDPKYQFVVLNVGNDKGAKVNGEMIINHDGKYISTIRITRVEKDFSFANILQDKDTHKGEALEGDEAIVSKFHNIEKKKQ